MPEECMFYICVFLSPLNKYVSSWLPSSPFLFFSLSMHKDLHFSYIFTHRLSWFYTWRAEIAFPGLLSHSEHTSKLLPCNLSYATNVHGHFFINVAKGVVILYLMWRGWLLHPSPFILLVTYAKFALFPLRYFNFMHLPWLMLVPKVS